MKKMRFWSILLAILCLVCVLALVSCDETPEVPGEGGDNGDQTEQIGNGGGEDEILHAHVWSEWTVTTAATCGTAGVQSRACACGESETRSIAATGEHIYGEWTTTTLSTCGVAGEQKRTCTCGASEAQPIAATGAHSYNTGNVCITCGTSLQYTDGLAYALNTDETAYTVAGIGTATDTDIVIPYYYEGKPVTSIGLSAFDGCESLTAITIPTSVTNIDCCAFYGSGLTSIMIPASVTNICCRAFEESDDLTTVNFADNSQLTIINWATFPYCDSLTTINFGNNSQLTSIDEDAFQDCDDLATVNFGENSQLTSIGYRAFYDCFSLTSIAIPPTVTSIGDYAFCGCNSLIAVNIGDNSQLASIGAYAFRDCTSLTGITIPAGVTNIGSNAFRNCFKLVEVYNLSSLNITIGLSSYGYVGFYAKIIHTSAAAQSKLFTDSDGFIFYNDETNRYLIGYAGTNTVLTLPASCNGNNYAINQYAFYGCNDLTSVTIPEGVTDIGWLAFEGTGVGELENGVCYVDKWALSLYNRSSATNVILRENTVGIGSCAFENCYSLTSITIPTSVTSIGFAAFCSFEDSLITSVYISDLAAWCNINFNGFEANPLHSGADLYLNGTLVTVLEIPNTVTSIKDYAFIGCTSITSVIIPASVTSIGHAAFGSLDSLITIIFEENSQLTSIGSYAFSDCYGLTSITIPSGVTSIADGAFSDCHKLIEVYNLSMLDVSGYFDNAKNIYTATMGESKLFTDSDRYLFYDDGTNRYLMGYTGTDTVLTLPASCKENNYEIYQYAFYECVDLTDVTIPASVTSIGDSAFSGCNSLTTVSFSGNSQLTSIGEGAFSYCDSLTNITIPTSVTSISANAFRNCDLTTVIFEMTEGWSVEGVMIDRDTFSETPITRPMEAAALADPAEAAHQLCGYERDWVEDSCIIHFNFLKRN